MCAHVCVCVCVCVRVRVCVPDSGASTRAFRICGHFKISRIPADFGEFDIGTKACVCVVCVRVCVRVIVAQ